MTRARVVMTTVLAVALLAVAGIAVASIPGPDGVISACYKNSNGHLSVIDSGATCPSGATLLTWNQAGQPGPPGPQGPVGQDGQDGSFAGFERVLGPVETVPQGGAFAPPFTLSLSCPEGKTAIWGGYEVLTLRSVNTMMENVDGGTYTYRGHNAGAAFTMQLHVTCAITD